MRIRYHRKGMKMPHLFKKVPLLMSHYSSSHLSALYTHSLFSPSPLKFSLPLTEDSFLALLACLFLVTPLSAQALSSSKFTPLFPAYTNSSKSAKKSSCFTATSTLQWLLLVVICRNGRGESWAHRQSDKKTVLNLSHIQHSLPSSDAIYVQKE